MNNTNFFNLLQSCYIVSSNGSFTAATDPNRQTSNPVFDTRSSASYSSRSRDDFSTTGDSRRRLEFYVAELFVIIRPSGNRARKARFRWLAESEPRESLNDVTFVVSLPRRRAFARLNCKLRLHLPPSRALRRPPRCGFFPQLSFPKAVLSPSLLKDLYSSSRRPDK